MNDIRQDTGRDARPDGATAGEEPHVLIVDDDERIRTLLRRFLLRSGYRVTEARDAAQKQAMAFELSDFDHQLLKFGELFRERFMAIDVALPLEDALDLSWQTLAECFQPEQLLMKQELVDKYFPKDRPAQQPAAPTEQPDAEEAEGGPAAA